MDGLNRIIESSHITVAAVSTVVASVATAIFMTYRKIIKEQRENDLHDSKASAEIDIINHLQEQRDYAMAEAKESKRSQILKEHENFEIKAKNKSLESELTQLKQRVQLLSQLVTRLTTALELTQSQLNNIIMKTQNTVE